jgi:hypothetical protein
LPGPSIRRLAGEIGIIIYCLLQMARVFFEMVRICGSQGAISEIGEPPGKKNCVVGSKGLTSAWMAHRIRRSFWVLMGRLIWL